jgi:hypothetical protein
MKIAKIGFTSLALKSESWLWSQKPGAFESTTAVLLYGWKISTSKACNGLNWPSNQHFLE